MSQSPGSKTLRIVAKDARHLWPEILLTLGITLGFALTEHYAWPLFDAHNSPQSMTLRGWLNSLMPVAWWLLTARAVHDESLVGDRQFWLTRPFGWPRVLAAKVIFITLFAVVPFVLTQVYLLHQAGLHPLMVVPGLLFKLLLLYGFILLPLLALSAVTSSIARMFIVLFGIFLYFVFAIYISTTFFATRGVWAPSSDSAPLVAYILLCALPVVCIVVVFLQYGRRYTLLSSTILAAFILMVTVFSIASEHVHKGLTGYPALAPAEPSPLIVALDPNPDLQYDNGDDSPLPSESVAIALPLHLSGIASGHAIRIEGTKETLDAPGIAPLELPWHGNFSGRFAGMETQAEDADIRQSINIPRETYDKIANGDVTVHLTLAITEYVSDRSSAVSFDGQAEDVPENGHCQSDPHHRFADCLYALRQPHLTRLTWKLNSNCSIPASAENREKWIGIDEDVPSDPVFSPVTPLFTNIELFDASPRHPVVALCLGSPITFTRYHLLRRRLLNVTLAPASPSRYRPPVERRSSDDIE